VLDRASRPSKPSFETTFRKWWIAQGPNFGSRVDVSVAKTIFRAGYASGRRASAGPAEQCGIVEQEASAHQNVTMEGETG